MCLWISILTWFWILCDQYYISLWSVFWYSFTPLSFLQRSKVLDELKRAANSIHLCTPALTRMLEFSPSELDENMKSVGVSAVNEVGRDAFFFGKQRVEKPAKQKKLNRPQGPYTPNIITQQLPQKSRSFSQKNKRMVRIYSKVGKFVCKKIASLYTWAKRDIPWPSTKLLDALKQSKKRTWGMDALFEAIKGSSEDYISTSYLFFLRLLDIAITRVF